MKVDGRVAGYLGRVVDDADDPIGTCFQVTPGVLVTAWHVLDDLGAGAVDAVVRFDPLRGGPSCDARVARIDPLHDLAVLVTADPLAGCVAELAASDEVRKTAPISITGASELDDPGHSYRYLDADGRWAGGTTRDDQVPLGRVVADAVLRGMSGAPVLLDDQVVGVVSARYNSVDGWGAGTVWVARTENLVPLLAGLADIPMARRPWGAGAELTLSIADSRVRLHGGGFDVSAAHGGVSSVLAAALHDLGAERARLTGLRAQDVGAAPRAVGAGDPGVVGRLLAQSFLPDPVGAAVREVIADAEGRWVPLRLGIEVTGRLRALPWEAMTLPGSGTPLALHPLLIVYRRHSGAPPAPSSGPLRIVIAVSAPLAGGSGVLDYERELRNVLAAVREARQGAARVRIVHFATTAEIHAALAAEPAHVLHLSGHGGPGMIELEDERGNARLLDAGEFVAEAIPAGRMPAVIALAACHTDAQTAAGDPSFAARLIGLGARVVIGTETAVTDRYATRVFTRIYGALAGARVPDVVAAVAQARRVVHQQLLDSTDPREQRLAGLGEWAVLTVLAATGSVAVFDPATPPDDDEPTAVASGRRMPSGLLARDVGEFVGRRRAQRRWPGELLGPGGVGLVLHGIGGIGKTTLAAELVARITERDPDQLVVIGASALTGATASVDGVFTALARALRRRSRGRRPDLDHAADLAQRVDLDWRERLAVVGEDVLDTVAVLLVLDNFEDNLTDNGVTARPSGWRSVADPDLAELLAALVNRPGRCRLLITSRYQFGLPGHAERALSFQPIGPLSQAETMKLAWRLPGLDRLTEPELDRVWRMVGGHPRCLEYLDALLCGGRGAYPDVTARLSARLLDRLGTSDLDAWFAAHTGLEPAITETLVQAADEVLLDRLLAQLATVPGAEALLLGVSVYRSAVDQAGVLFQVGDPDPDATPHLAELDRVPTPPRRDLGNLRRGLDACSASSLLVHDTDQNPPAVFVHRWTAGELRDRWVRTGRGEQLVAAHRRAAEYWHWRVQVWQ